MPRLKDSRTIIHGVSFGYQGQPLTLPRLIRSRARELEALLLTHPAVADVAVIGRSDSRRGEVPVAYVVPRGSLDAQTLIAWVAARVVEYKCLDEVRFCDAIPKSPSGKILRRILRAQDRPAAGAS